jgi:DNA polymerase III alpha subunit (gram-positive type)
VRNAVDPQQKKPVRQENYTGKHTPVIEKQARSFSIKEIISGTEEPAGMNSSSATLNEPEKTTSQLIKTELTGDSFASAWKEFTENLKGEGARIMSMFKTIKPEIEDENTIILHLSNAAQKDIFIQNYKPKLLNFLENRFMVSELEIETTIDVAETNELLYSDEQKLNYLQNKYPVLKDFKKAFNLDIT